MIRGPLERIDDLLPPHIRVVADRDTPIPTIAQRAKDRGPDLVRCDIGQIAGVAPELEVLYGPPIGLEPLRAAVAELYRLSFHLDGISAKHVAICTGAAEALSILFRCFAHQRTVGLPRGHWENYTNGVDMAGGRASLVDFFDAQGRFDAAALERQIRDLGVSVLVANFPCNPTGVALDAAETESLARVIIATGVVAIADEVYARLRYDGVPPQTLLEHAPAHAVSVGSASKEYLLPGARVGYVAAANADLTDRVLRRVVRASSASPSVLGQEALLGRLQSDLVDLRAGRPPSLIARICRAMRERRDALLAVLERHGMRPGGREPAGTIFLMARLPSWWHGDDEAFCEHALTGGYLSCIPGTAFGLPGSVRLSYGAMSPADIARLDERLSAMARAL